MYYEANRYHQFRRISQLRQWCLDEGRWYDHHVGGLEFEWAVADMVGWLQRNVVYKYLYATQPTDENSFVPTAFFPNTLCYGNGRKESRLTVECISKKYAYNQHLPSNQQWRLLY